MTSFPTAGLVGIEAILFDFDGTLVYQVIDFRVINQRVRGLAAQAGVEVARHEHLYTLEFIEAAAQDLEAANGSLAARFREEAHAIVVEEEVLAARRAQVFPGVPELLSMLREEGIKVGIVTRNCRSAVAAILARHPIQHDVLLTRDDVEQVKPHPAHLESAVQALGVSSRRTLMVGDHPMDVVAGKAAVAWSIGILNDGRPADYFDAVSPDAVLDSVVRIPAYLAGRPLQAERRER